MKKRYLAVLAAACVLVASCSAQKTPAWQGETLEHARTDLGLKIRYPDTWFLLNDETKDQLLSYSETIFENNPLLAEALRQIDQGSMVYLLDLDFNQDDSANSINIIAEENTAGTTLNLLKTYSSDILQTIGAALSDMDIENGGQITNIGGKEVFVIQYTGAVGDFEARWYQVFLIGTNKLYTFTLTSQPGEFERTKKIADEIIEFMEID